MLSRTCTVSCLEKFLNRCSGAQPVCHNGRVSINNTVNLIYYYDKIHKCRNFEVLSGSVEATFGFPPSPHIHGGGSHTPSSSTTTIPNQHHKTAFSYIEISKNCALVRCSLRIRQKWLVCRHVKIVADFDRPHLYIHCRPRSINRNDQHSGNSHLSLH